MEASENNNREDRGNKYVNNGSNITVSYRPVAYNPSMAFIYKGCRVSLYIK